MDNVINKTKNLIEVLEGSELIKKFDYYKSKVISNKDIMNLCVPIPPIELQEQFADFVAQVDKSKVAVQKALDEAQLLFDSLMQKYFG